MAYRTLFIRVSNLDEKQLQELKQKNSKSLDSGVSVTGPQGPHLSNQNPGDSSGGSGSGEQ